MHLSLPSLKFLLFALIILLLTTSTTSLPKPECEDMVINCPTLMNINCEDPTLKKFCRKTCGICQDGNEIQSDKATQNLPKEFQGEVINQNQTRPKPRIWNLGDHAAKERVLSLLDDNWGFVPRDLIKYTQQLLKGVDCKNLTVDLHANKLDPGQHKIKPDWIHQSSLIGYCPVKYNVRGIRQDYQIPRIIIEAQCQCENSLCHRKIPNFQCTELSILYPIWFINTDDKKDYTVDLEKVSIGCACVGIPGKEPNILPTPIQGREEPPLPIREYSKNHITGEHHYCGPYRKYYTDKDCEPVGMTGRGSSDVDDCQDLCDRNYDCSAFNWSPRYRQCVLRNCGKNAPVYPSGRKWISDWYSFSERKPYGIPTCLAPPHTIYP